MRFIIVTFASPGNVNGWVMADKTNLGSNDYVQHKMSPSGQIKQKEVEKQQTSNFG